LLVKDEIENKSIFDQIDRDGDGRINKGEMADFFFRLTKF